ncbi:14624_t:CDS:1 [Funneliformis geosporum]|uniref:1067_t:CDS:1 n=1 Tax=Funneliformis geosporum TaxID=1117311 RepID=A0A9W4SEM8_9GLOM|nr:14624_t:CDS:1 [Funneliformis geosporum]CAI2166660.1 1067_t:CDS:1 [Funneliformis geosporum]
MKSTHTKDFSCIVCPKKFYDKAELNEHSREHIGENFLPSTVNASTTFMPPTTYPPTIQPSSIIPQEMVHEDDVTFLHKVCEDHNGSYFLKCNLCIKTTFSYASFRLHAKKAHKYEWLCLVCCQVLPTRNALGSHMSKNHRKCFPCTVCPKECFDNTELNDHVRANHSRKKLSSGKSKGMLTIHELISAQPISIKCKICSEIFDTHLKFNKHIRLHGVNFSCRYCSQAFYLKWVKKSHVNQVHRFSCKECNRFFLTAKSLSDHCSSKAHQKNTNSSVQPQLSQLEMIQSTAPQDSNFAQEEGSRSKTKESPEFLHDFIKNAEMENDFAEYLLATYNFKCKSCKQIFGSRLEFNEHVKQEHDLIHICEICSLVHYNELSLLVHRNNDHSIKEFYCNYCNSSYFLEKELHDHIFEAHVEKDAQPVEVSMEVEYANEYEGCSQIQGEVFENYEEYDEESDSFVDEHDHVLDAIETTNGDEGHSKMQVDVNRPRTDDYETNRIKTTN